MDILLPTIGAIAVIIFLWRVFRSGWKCDDGFIK